MWKLRSNFQYTGICLPTKNLVAVPILLFYYHFHQKQREKKISETEDEADFCTDTGRWNITFRFKNRL